MMRQNALSRTALALFAACCLEPRSCARLGAFRLDGITQFLDGDGSSRKVHYECEDTPAWTNPKGYTCTGVESYEQKSWCTNGDAAPGKSWSLGKKFNYPERACCICGKGELEEVNLEIKSCKQRAHNHMTLCASIPYAQQLDFIKFAEEFRTDNGGIMTLISDILSNERLAKLIPKLRAAFGVEETDGDAVCINNKKICGAVERLQQRQAQGSFDEVLVSGSSGKYCQADANNVRRLSYSQIAALSLYTWTKRFNRILRSQSRKWGSKARRQTMESCGVFTYHLLTALDCIDGDKTPQHVYRGIKARSEAKRDALLADYAEGRLVVWTSMTSTSSDVKKALRRFGAGKRGKHTGRAIMFNITQTHAFNVQYFSQHRSEKEHLIPLMSMYKVARKYIQDEVHWIELVQIDSGLFQNIEFGDDALVF